jgi:hypothetical protein
MGYYMRYIMVDKQQITLTDLEVALRQIDPVYMLQADEVPEIADLFFADKRLAQIEINHSDEDIFEDDIFEFKDLVGSPNDANARKVLDALNNATALIAVECFWEEGQAEDTLGKLDPLWNWLFANRSGVLQADGEGFYDVSGLILERNFTL